MSLLTPLPLRLFVAVMSVLELLGPEPNLVLVAFGGLWVLVGSLLAMRGDEEKP